MSTPPRSKAAPTRPLHAPTPKPIEKRQVILAVLALVAMFLVMGAVKWWQQKLDFVSTDDAQVTGRLVDVSPRVAGQIVSMRVDEGQPVKAGQVIALVDDTGYKAEVAQAKANLEVAESTLESAQQGVSLQSLQSNSQQVEAAAVLSAARATATGAAASRLKAKQDYDRGRKLFESGAMALDQFQGVQAAYQDANARYTAAMHQVAAAQAALDLADSGNTQVVIRRDDVRTTQAKIDQARAALQLAELNLQHTQVKAPVPGIVVKRYVNAGEMVQPGQALLTLSESDDVWVVANVKETEIHRVGNGALVDLDVDAYPGQRFEGHVVEVIGATGSQFSLMPTNNAAGNFTKVVQRIPVRIDVDDPTHLLKPGMSVVVHIHARR